MITLKNVTARYRNTSQQLALDNISLEVARRQTTVLLGGSGAGKSTILKAILRLIEIDSGAIFVDDCNIAERDKLSLRRSIGTVFQGAALFPHMNARDNIALPLRLEGMRKKAIEARVDELMELVGLEPSHYAKRYPHMLSGGQQQRIGVARALATRPAYLLMDEPFGALDAITRRNLQTELKHWRQVLDVTILFVTHDIMEAVNLGDSLTVMDKGKILQSGSVRTVMEKPANEIVNQLVSKPLKELSTFVKDSV